MWTFRNYPYAFLNMVIENECKSQFSFITTVYYGLQYWKQISTWRFINFLRYSFILIIRLDISHEPTYIIHSCLLTFNFYMLSYLNLFLFAKVVPTKRSYGTNTINTITTYRKNIQLEHNWLYGYAFLDFVLILFIMICYTPWAFDFIQRYRLLSWKAFSSFISKIVESRSVKLLICLDIR